MSQVFTRYLICLSTLLTCGIVRAAPTVTNLGRDLLPQAVSDDGKTIAGLSIRENQEGVFRWAAADGVQALGGLVTGKADISANGATISGTIFTDRAEAAFWKKATGWVPLSATGLVPALPG